MKLNAKDNKKVILYAVLLAVAVLFPFVINNGYIIRIASMIFMYSIIAVSLNLIGGFGGELAMGHAAYLAVGAYITALLATRAGLPFLVTFPLSIIGATIFGLLTGFICVGRIKGDSVMILTMGVTEITRIVLINEVELTNGPMGISRIPGIILFGKEYKGNTLFYFLFLIFLLLTIWIINNIVNSKFGRNLVAIREDDVAARAMGIRVNRTKVIAFTISCLFAGISGALLAHYNHFIGPSQFNLDEGLLYYQMLIIGGLGSTPGAVLGAAILVLIPEAFRGISIYRPIVYGLIMVIMMIVRPQGILGVTEGTSSFKKLSKKVRALFSGKKETAESEEGGAE